MQQDGTTTVSCIMQVYGLHVVNFEFVCICPGLQLESERGRSQVVEYVT